VISLKIPSQWLKYHNCTTKEEAVALLQADTSLVSSSIRQGAVPLLHYLTASSSIQSHHIEALIEAGANLLVTDHRGRNCLQVCVSPEAASVLAPHFNTTDISRAIRNALMFDRHAIIEVLVKFTQVDIKLLEYAVKQDARRSLPILSKFIDSTPSSRLWRQVISREISLYLIDLGCPILPDIQNEITNTEVLELLVTSYNLPLSDRSMQLLVDNHRIDVIGERYSIPESVLISVAARDDLQSLKKLLHADSIHLASVATTAAKHGSIACLTWLLETSLDKINSSPLVSAACEFVHNDTVELLLSAGVEPNILDSRGRSPLHILSLVTGEAIGQRDAPSDYIHLAKSLVTLLSNIVNLQDTDRGDTALHIAVKESNWQMVRLLMAAGAEKGVRNDLYITAEEYAVKQQCLEKFLECQL
jgi:Ankyrin repeat